MQGCETFRLDAICEGHPVDCPGRMLGLHCIHDNNPVGLLDLRQRIEKGGPDFESYHIFRQQFPLKGAGDMHAHALVAEKKIAYSENKRFHGYRLAPAFTMTTGFPSGRMTCTAQERQGSKEWMTRITSIGWDALAIVVPINACSIGPRTPFVSFGEAFQQVGVITW